MALIWTNKQDNVDYIMAEDVNSLAAAIIDNEESIANINTDIDGKVDKVAGKGLSSNDYTDEEKAKLADLPNSAEYSSTINALETEIGGKVDKEDGKGLSDAASVSVYHANAGNEVLQLVGQDGVTKLTAFYGMQAVDDQMSAFSLGLSTKVDKDTTGMRGLSNAKDVNLIGSASEASELEVTDQSGSSTSSKYYNSFVMDKMLAKLKEQSVPHTAVSDYPVTLTDALAGESLRGLKVYGKSSKNLVNIAGRTVVSNWAFANTSKRVLTGNQIIGGYAASNYVLSGNVTISEVTDESISIVSQSNAYGVGLDVEICPNTEYHISGNSGNIGRIMVGLYDKNGNFLKTTGGTNNFTFTTPENAKWAVVALTATGTIEGSVGSLITFSEIQLEEGSTATAYEKYYAGVGDGGKNLLPYPYYHGSRTTNGITYTDNGDGTITASGTATNTAYHYEARITTENMLCEGGKTYTFSWGGVGSSSTYYGFVRVDDVVKTATATGSVTFTPSTSQYVDVGFLIISGVTVDNLVIKPQIEEGSAATEYEPPRKNLFDKESDFDATRQNYPPTITRENNAVVVSADGSSTTKMGAWIIPTSGKTTFTISADSVAFEGSPTVLIREADSFPEYITTVSTFGNAVDTITAQEGFTKTVNISSAYIAIVMQAAGEQKITFDNLRVTAPTYKIPVRLQGKNLIPYPYADTTKTVNGITFTDNGGTITANGTATADADFFVAAQSNAVGAAGGRYTLSGCPTGGSQSTYGMFYYDTVTSQYDTGDGVSFTAKGVISVTIRIRKGAVCNNLTFSPMLENGAAVTGYEPYITPQVQTATLTSPLTSGEYIDLLSKKRYALDGTATDITVEGELKTTESGSITIDCTTGVQPPRIDAEYWQDINKVVGNLTSAILANGGNA